MVAVGFVLVLVMLVVFGGMGFAVYKQIQKTDPKNLDTSVISAIDTAQQFLPFEDIKDDMIILGGHQYRAVIECSSTNYNLKTEREKEVIELSFQRFLNSIKFPIAFFIQTRTIDNTKVLEGMEKEHVEVIEKYPQMAEYAEVYFYEMSNLSVKIGNNKQKKKYIIVSFNDGINLGELSDIEKYEYSMKELQSRTHMVIDGLSGVGVKAKILDTHELMELVYSTYHKDNYLHVENIVNGEFLSLITEAPLNRQEQINDDAKVDWILYEAQMRIQNELMSQNLPEFLKNDYEDVIGQLDQLRDKTGGYFKDRTVNLYK